MRIHLQGTRRPIAVAATVALAAVGLSVPAAAAPVEDDSENTGSVAPQETTTEPQDVAVEPQNTNTEPVTIDLVGITDFHGYIETAPFLKTQIDEIRAQNPDTHFVSAGDNIGGSAYVSSIANDQPTLDILDAMGLDVSAVGNHEFDQGYADLRDRVIPDVDFSYLGANVGGADEIAEPPYDIVDIDGVNVAFIGTVTETTPTIVSKDGVAGLTFNDPVAVTNDIAADLKDGDDANGEADVVVSLFHEGDSFAKGLGADVDLVFAGHTHIVSETTTDGGAPILQAGEYGKNFAHASLTVAVDGTITIDSQAIVALDETVTPDADVEALVDDAVAEAEVLGAEVLAEITDNAWRGTNDGTDPGANRGTESSMGNHLANAALFTAENFDMGADFGIINPGGVRADMDQDGNGEVTYGEAYTTQPFGNTIGTIDLTGEQVYTMLEQQFQPEQPRPVLRLGLSDNVTYTYDPTAEDGGDITGVWIDGEAVDPAATYTIASNTFLLGGQDGFTVFTEGTNFRETGYVDLNGYVDYLEAGHGETIPAGQRSIGLVFDETELVAGGTLDIELSSLAFTAFEEKPTTVTLSIDGVEVGSADIDTTVTSSIDDTGTATVEATIPAVVADDAELRIVTTYEDGSVDTDFALPVEIAGGVQALDIVGITDFHGYIETAPFLKTQIDQIRAQNPDTHFVSAGDNIGGSAYVSSIANDQPTLDILDAMGLDVSAVGNHEFDQGYADLRDRVIPDVDFSYLGANVGGADEIAEPPYELVEVEGVTVAYIGTVTADTPNIVAQDGIAGLTFNDPVAVTNDIAADLKDGDDANGEADIVVSLFHEGDTFAKGLDENVDLVFAGHTHIVSEDTTDGGAPILQAGEYGKNFAHARILLAADGADIVLTEIVELDETVAADPDIEALVDDAVAEAEVLGAEVLAEITDNAWRGTNDGTDPGANRGTESSMGNHLANAALFTAENFDMGADFGIINPGGVRADMDQDGNGEVTYGEAYTTQPFGNTIGTIDLTGEQVYTMLEQQFQPEQPRPVLRLGLSDNVTYTYDPTAEDGGDITGVWIDGEAVDPAATYTIASNTFLLGGQDGFTVFTEGTNFRETGYVDLNGYVDYLEAGHGDTINPGQRSIGLEIGEQQFAAGETVNVSLSSLAFTAFEEKPTTVTLSLNGEEVGSADIDTTVTSSIDDTGQATVEAALPGDAPEESVLRIVTTFEDGSVDTDVEIPVTVLVSDTKPEPIPGKWFYVSNDWTASEASIEFAYGRVNDVVLVGDWDGDGADTLAVRRGHTYYFKNSLVGGQADVELRYGRDDDVVLVGDWDGDGVDTLAVRRGDTYFIKNDLTGGQADAVINYGRDADEVYAGDWDNDGEDTLAVRRGDTFFVKNTMTGGNADVEFHYGRASDEVFAGDWDGNDGDSFALRRGHTWFMKNDLAGGNADLVLNYGRTGDDAFVGDWDGDEIDTPAVRR